MGTFQEEMNMTVLHIYTEIFPVTFCFLAIRRILYYDIRTTKWINLGFIILISVRSAVISYLHFDRP